MAEARYTQSIVDRLLPNRRIVLHQVGEFANVRVFVGDNSR